jgi:hypothetical protein
MSDKWLNRQHDEVKERNRQQRLAQMAEAERLRALRRAQRR